MLRNWLFVHKLEDSFSLRYINPAIVTPQAYMLIDNCPEEQPRRTLTLIAKMLQNLANKPSYAKEPYMLHLAPFLDANKSRMNAFLNRLCEVPDFYDTLEVFHELMRLTIDGSIYCLIEERCENSNHSQRDLQHTLPSCQTFGSVGTTSVVTY